MSKFKVGDKVQILCNDDSQFDIGTIGIIKSNDGSGHREWEVDFNGTSEWFDGDEIELTTPKLTKNQRITALEETVAKQGEEIEELKLIVGQIRQPSTDVQEALDKAQWETGEVEGVIEFEGKQYRKVDREAREGDVVILREPAEQTPYVKNDMPYKVVRGYNGKPYLIDSTVAYLYDGHFGRTPETVDVYELIVEDKPKTANQLRAEMIEKAKRFVAKHTSPKNADLSPLTQRVGSVRIKFEVNVEKRTVVALGKLAHVPNKYGFYKGIAKCHPSDVFNEHIGKAIALGRALGVDVSEFEQAVQPTIAVGQITNHGEVYAVKPTHRTRGYDTGHKFLKADEGYTVIDSSGYEEWLPIEWAEILNDTNAQYEVGEQ